MANAVSFLLERLRDNAAPALWAQLQPVTRRHFLIGTTAAGVVSASALSAGAPSVRSRGQSVLVEYGGLEWDISPEQFGPSATTSWRWRDRETIELRLARATLVGTDIDASFVATIGKRGKEWILSLAIPGLRFDAEAPLLQWLSGRASLQSRHASRGFSMGAAPVRFAGSTASLDVSRTFTLTFSAERISLSSAGTFVGKVLRLEPAGPGPGSLRAFLQSEQRDQAGTKFALHELETSDAELRFEGIEGNRTTVHFDAIGSIGGEAFASSRGPRLVRLYDASAMIRTQAGMDDPAPELFFDRAVCLTDGKDSTLVARASRQAHALDIGIAVATVRGEDDVPLVLQARDGIIETANFSVRLQQLDVPVEGGGVGRFLFRDLNVTISLPGREATAGRKFSPGEELMSESDTSARPTVAVASSIDPNVVAASAADEPRNLIVLSREPFALFELNASSLEVRRPADLLRLSFTFDGFRLRVRQHKAVFERRRNGSVYPKALISVLFPPQHLAETQYELENPITGTPKIKDKKTGQFYDAPVVSRSRVSGPSRVVFKLEKWTNPHKPAPWDRRELSIGNLTSWESLTMEVNARAQPANVELSKQLELAGGINSNTDITDVFDKIAGGFQAPGSWETSLETHDRLLFSPAVGKWITPKGDLDRREVALWNARLDRAGRESVRALWSHYLVNGRLPSRADLDLVDSKLEKDYLVTLTPVDHWNIVAQTSVYGLPALLRTKDKNSADPVDKALSTVPRSLVIRPGDWKFLKQIDCSLVGGTCGPLPCAVANPSPDSGIALPSCFDDADLILTSIGANVRARWTGDPPILEPAACSNVTIPAAFGLERLTIETYLGRDIEVESVTKGFLLPLGLRASYVQLTERRLYRHPRYSYPVAYPVKRRFIVVNKPGKNFPTVNQPYLSHDFPADSISLLTTVTPDLVEPLTRGDGVMFDASGVDKSNLAFWPVTVDRNNRKSDVDFRWTVNGEATPVVSNLFFMANQLLSDEGTMKNIAEAYRNLAETGVATTEDPRTWPTRRTARVGGVKRRYAPSDGDEGKTSFSTDSWLLSYRGRMMFGPTGAGSTAPDERFLMDARMNGADQPPAYPFLQFASVSIQSLDQLVGAPQGLVSIGFNSRYTEAGFDKTTNISEIFADFVGPRPIRLGASKQSSAVGGFADTSTTAAALSRKSGIVGAQPIAKSTGGTRSRAVKATALPPPRYDIGDALDGKFNPAKFFENVKLCGIIELGKVLATVEIDNAPKLLEQLGFGALLENAQGTEEELNRRALAGIKALVVDQDLFGKAATSVAAFRDQLNAAIKSATGNRADLAQVYPTLSEKLNRAYNSLTSAKGSLSSALDDPGTTLAGVATLLSTPVRAADDVLQEIERIVRDPVPPAVQDFINNAAVQWVNLRDGLQAQFFGIGKDLLSRLVQPGIESIFDKLDSYGLLPFVFGSASKAEIVREPERYLATLGEALFADLFGGPLRELLVRAREVEALATAKILWLRALTFQNLTSEIQREADAIKARLDSNNHPNISDEGVPAGLAEAIVGKIDERIATAVAGAAISDLDGVKRALDLISAIDMTAAISAGVRSSPALFKPASGNPNALMIEFENAVLANLNRTVKSAIASEIDRINLEISKISGDARLEFLRRLLGSLGLMLDGVTSALQFSRISQVGRAINDWCAVTATAATARAVRLAEVVSSRTAGTASDLNQFCVDFGDALDAIQMPSGTPQEVIDEVNRQRAALKAILARILSKLSEIQSARATWATIIDPSNGTLLVDDICSKVSDFLEPTQNLIRLRRDVTVLVAEAANRLLDLKSYTGNLFRHARLNSATFGTFGNPRVLSAVSTVDANIKLATKALGGLVREATSILQIATNKTSWSDLKDFVAELTSDGTLATIGTFKSDLEKAIGAIETDAGKLASDIKKALGESPAGDPDIAALAALGWDIVAYAAARDRQVASLALQTAAFVNSLAADLKSSAAGIVKNLADVLGRFHTLVHDLIAVITDAVDQNPVLALIINENALDAIKNGNKGIKDDANALIALTTTTDDQLPGAARLIADRWKAGNIPIEKTLTALAGIVDGLLRGQLGAIVSQEKLKQLAAAAQDELTEIVTKLVPTRVDLSYHWQTDIPSIGGIFEMVAPAANDLEIRSNISADFVSGARSYEIKGVLQAFNVKLFGDVFDIATIKFMPGTFTSRNGSKPDFNLKVDDVKLGQVLEYLKPLQSWMSPKDGGFYVMPVIGANVGLEAGYTFDADIITLGAISFVNVSFGVAARLFFDGKDAEFIFNFASPGAPFLISAPPYGGGGYLSLRANPQRITGFGLGFAFGACVAFRFGPLSASGRVTVGFGIDYDGIAGTCTIILRFDAVGEGSIGCFGISVQVTITAQSKTGQSGISGTVSQRFTFKIGFFKISLGFTAAYGVDSGGGAAVAALGTTCQLEGGSCHGDPKAPKIVNLTPKKRQHWNQYKQRVALDLLKGAA